MNDDPAVSIIIPTYNGEKYIEETLLSIFNQTYKNYEVIVVDDGSTTNGTARICDKYKDRLRYIRQENRGPSAARNTGIRNMKGKYIAFLDDDDMWLPEKLDKQVSFYYELKARGLTPGLIYTGYRVITEDGEHLFKILMKTSGNDYTRLMFVNFIGAIGSVLVAKAILDDVGLFDEDVSSSEDWELWLRVAKKYELYFMDEFLVKVRKRQESLSKNIPSMINNRKLISNKLLAGEADLFNADKDFKKKFLRYHNTEIAYGMYSWKDYAYQCLFERKDAKSFRRYIREAITVDIFALNLKVATYYVLSFFSPSLCIKIKGLKKENPPIDIICNVRDMGLY